MATYCYNCMNSIENNTGVCPHCGQAPFGVNLIHQLKPGTLLRGRYLVGKALGQGGFGITYIGLDTTLELRVAIKEYYPNGYAYRNNEETEMVTIIASDQDRFYSRALKWFLHEAKTLAKFNNEPGIVSVRDFFEENNTAYIVMDYLEGITLKEYVSSRGAISADILFSGVTPIIRGLGKVHEAGIIHRDVSPDNIMVTRDGGLKLLDFGAAREVGGDMSRSLSVMLKPGYAPEEQYRSHGKQGPWTDVYSLCATIYYCLTGAKPDESVERLVEDKLKRPSELGVKISPTQESVILRGMSVRAADRYQSMMELSNAMDTAKQIVEQERRLPEISVSKPELETKPEIKTKSQQEAKHAQLRARLTSEPKKNEKETRKRKTDQRPVEPQHTKQKAIGQNALLKKVGKNALIRVDRIAAGTSRLIKIAARAAVLCFIFLLLWSSVSYLIDSVPMLLSWEEFLQRAEETMQCAEAYADGDGVDQDYTAAMDWYQKAADFEIAEAMYAIGELYYKGNGINQDYASAMDWYQKAASAGSAAAMCSIGKMYYEGSGVEQDNSMAMLWVRNAEENGYEEYQYAMLLLDILHIVRAFLSFSAWGLLTMLLAFVGMIVVRRKMTKSPI